LSFKAATTKADTKPKVFDPTEAKPTTTAMSGKLSFGQPTVMSEKFSFGQMKDEKLADDSEEKEDVTILSQKNEDNMVLSQKPAKEKKEKPKTSGLQIVMQERKEKKRTEYRKRLTAIYKKHMPEKLKKVDALVEKYTAWGVPDNRLHETYEKVCKKYKQTPQSAYDGQDAPPSAAPAEAPTPTEEKETTRSEPKFNLGFGGPKKTEPNFDFSTKKDSKVDKDLFSFGSGDKKDEAKDKPGISFSFGSGKDDKAKSGDSGDKKPLTFNFDKKSGEKENKKETPTLFNFTTKKPEEASKAFSFKKVDQKKLLGKISSKKIDFQTNSKSAPFGSKQSTPFTQTPQDKNPFGSGMSSGTDQGNKNPFGSTNGSSNKPNKLNLPTHVATPTQLPVSNPFSLNQKGSPSPFALNQRSVAQSPFSLNPAAQSPFGLNPNAQSPFQPSPATTNNSNNFSFNNSNTGQSPFQNNPNSTSTTPNPFQAATPGSFSFNSGTPGNLQARKTDSPFSNFNSAPAGNNFQSFNQGLNSGGNKKGGFSMGKMKKRKNF